MCSLCAKGSSKIISTDRHDDSSYLFWEAKEKSRTIGARKIGASTKGHYIPRASSMLPKKPSAPFHVLGGSNQDIARKPCKPRRLQALHVCVFSWLQHSAVKIYKSRISFSRAPFPNFSCSEHAWKSVEIAMHPFEAVEIKLDFQLTSSDFWSFLDRSLRH